MRFVARSVIRTTPERLFAFHELPDVLQRLVPDVRVIQSAPSLRPGARAIVEIRVAFFRIRIESLHTRYDPPRSFEDEQVRGPFRKWRHVHRIEAHPDGAELIDEIDWEMPVGFIARWFVTPRLKRMFDYRHRVTREWCEGP